MMKICGQSSTCCGQYGWREMKEGSQVTDLHNKTVFITGTNRGLGRAFAEEFVRCGANVIAHARTENEAFKAWCAELAAKAGVKVTPVFFDLTDSAAMRTVVQEIFKSKVPIDILVNNAGITHNALFQMSSEKMLREEFEVNVFSVFSLTQYILKIMLRQRAGVIVNVSSISGLRGDVGRSIYGMTKAALASLTQSLAAEVGRAGIRVNAVAPGFIDTDMMGAMTQEVINQNVAQSRLGRMGKPEEVAKLVAYLASDDSSYMTGEVVRITGGL